MDDITFQESRTTGGQLGPTKFAGHRLALQLNGPVPLEVWRGGRFVAWEKQPDRFAVMPPGATVGVRWSQDHHFLLATLAPDLVARILLEAAEGRPISLIERHGCDDPHARHLMLALWADVAGGRPSGRLYSETLVRGLVLRLLAAYTEGRTWKIAPATLQRVQEYIEAHLANNPSLAELAALAGLSPC